MLALDGIGSTLAIPALLKAYADESLRADAFPALARTPDERALDALLEGLSSKNPAQRNAAHLALRDISGRVQNAVGAKAGSLSPQALTELRQIYAGDKQAEGGPIFAKQIKQYTLEEYMDATAKLAGDSARGQKLFAEPGGVNCVACHRVAGKGADLGGLNGADQRSSYAGKWVTG